MSLKIDKIFWVQRSRVQASSRTESKRSEAQKSKRPVVQSPDVQSPSVQSPSVQASRVQASRCPESKRPEYRRPNSKHPGHVSRVQLFQYAFYIILSLKRITNCELRYNSSNSAYHYLRIYKLKRAKAARRILKTNLDNGTYNNMKIKIEP